MDDRTKCRYKGEEMDLGDARMMLTKAELEEVEVVMADGSVVRPYRFCEIDPVFSSGKNGILSF